LAAGIGAAVVYSGLSKGSEELSQTGRAPTTSLPSTDFTVATISAPETTARGRNPDATTGPVAKPTTTLATAEPTTAATTTTAPPVPRDVAECERIASSASLNVAFAPNRQMTVHHTYGVTVLIGLDVGAIKQAPQISESSTTVVTVQAGQCTMTVTLTGLDFDVRANSSDDQSFIGTRVLEWDWQVSPKRTGDALVLRVDIQPSVTDPAGGTRPGSASKLEEDILVRSEPEGFWEATSRHLDDLAGNDLVKVLFIPSGGLLVALTIWLFRRLRKRGASEDREEEENRKEKRKADAPTTAKRASKSASGGNTSDRATAKSSFSTSKKATGTSSRGQSTGDTGPKP
jgi:hypothetical protein